MKLHALNFKLATLHRLAGVRTTDRALDNLALEHMDLLEGSLEAAEQSLRDAVDMIRIANRG